MRQLFKNFFDGRSLAALRIAIRNRWALDLRGKTVLITGGSRGLGLVLARQLLRAGARVAICARDVEELARARRQLEELGPDVLTVRCDVRDKDDVDAMVQRVRERFHRIDILINSVAVIQVGPATVMTLDDYHDTMNTHFFGALHTTLAVLPEMRARSSGRIINIASLAGKMPTPHLLPYSASKSALVGFSEGLRAELLHEGIYVTTVCPSAVRTGMYYHAFFKGQYSGEFTWFGLLQALPLLSSSAERTARQIIAAGKRGRAEVETPAYAWLLARLHPVFPGLFTELLSLVNRALPKPGGIGECSIQGMLIRTPLVPSVLTWLNDRAAQKNNQFPDGGLPQ